MRRFSLNDKLNAAIAGALSAISLLVDEKQRRVFFALVLFSRALVSHGKYLDLYYRIPSWTSCKSAASSTNSTTGTSSAGPWWAASTSISCHSSLSASRPASAASTSSTQPWRGTTATSVGCGFSAWRTAMHEELIASLFINQQLAFTRLIHAELWSPSCVNSLCTYTY